MRRSFVGITAVVLIVSQWMSLATACPFCSAVSMTFSEEINNSDAAAIIVLADPPKQDIKEATPTNNADELPANLPITKTRFKIVKVLKGNERLADTKTIEILYLGDQPPETQFMVFGVASQDFGDELGWSTPTPLTPRAVKYLDKVVALPESMPERLKFFQTYFEDKDPMLAADAYDEFAKAPYADIIAIKDDLPHDKLMGWIQDPDLSASRRRLYLTMLGVCGQPADIPVLEDMLKSDDREVRTALDALIACYLNLKGPEGLELVEQLFMSNPDAEFTDTYATIMALRFHGQETDVVPKPRLIKSLELMLDRPQLADLVIPDLARWQDWSAMDKMVDLFKNADDQAAWVRVPVINFLRQVPASEGQTYDKAQAYIEELAAIDPEAVKRATTFFPIAKSTVGPNDTRAGSEALADNSDTPNTDTAGDPLVPPPSDDVQLVNDDQSKNKESAAAAAMIAGKGGDSDGSAGPKKAKRKSGKRQVAAATPTSGRGRALDQAGDVASVLLGGVTAGFALLLLLVLIVRGGGRRTAPG